MPAAGNDTSAENVTLPDEKRDTVDNNEEVTDSVEEPPKKRRRTAKPNSDKKFECKHDGCGKSYSRAEHLYRHQLNHSPKQIYRCDFPDCNRYFVRQDLCVRHRERHTTHGSQLHKRDTFAQTSVNVEEGDGTEEPLGDFDQTSTQTGNGPSIHASNDAHDEIGAVQAAVHRSRLSGNVISPAGPEDGLSLSTQSHAFSKPNLPAQRNGNLVGGPLSPERPSGGALWSNMTRNDSFMSVDNRSTSLYGQNGFGQTVPHSPARTYSDSSTPTNGIHNFKPRSNSFRATSEQQSYLPNPGMTTPNGLSNTFHSPEMIQQHQSQSNDAFSAAVSQGLTPSRTDPFSFPPMNTAMSSFDANNTTYGYPIFGGDDFNRSPFALADDFTAWLFNDGSNGSTGFSPNNFMAAYGDGSVPYVQGPTFTQSPTSSLQLQNPAVLPNAMSRQNLPPNSVLNSYIMSEEKRQELLDIMQNQFVERPHDAVKKRKDSVFEGDIDADGHILSLRMMHTYIGSYWYHQHAQLPILHKPTFSADKTSNLLLLAVIAIGAATLDKAYGTALTDSAAEFANFLAWHLRWEIVRDADFRSPAKLWIFQTLLLIEVYEKMYSTRALHERAHIHHDSTLTLMRRGSSLMNRSASDTPPSGPEDVHKPTDSSAPEQSKSEASWARWVAAESTRRVAFAAFVIDSIHCTMFGHSAKMVAHEMRLPLPCDEGLWSATSPSEVGRVQSSLQTNGVKPIMFLDGLKKTLNGQRVRTNSFGRTVIMAGLLSVSWHMTQRDLQISSLGPRTAGSFGDGKNWKGVLLRAFDNWKRDFDEALAESATRPPSPARNPSGPSIHSLVRPIDDENIFESRTVLHHLAHIAAHVDIVECQVFAGANRLLSRSVTPKDYSVIREKIERWATKASARDSAFYALKFIAAVLTPPSQADSDGDEIDGFFYGHASPILPQAFDRNQYVARDDFLLNRPWVLYISALVVWCYGYALEGPISPKPRDEDFETYEQRETDLQNFLDRVASVRAPDDLEQITGKNKCLGLLLILKDSFASTRWELTHEAARLLGNAAMKLKGEGESLLRIRSGKKGGPFGNNTNVVPGIGRNMTTPFTPSNGLNDILMNDLK